FSSDGKTLLAFCLPKEGKEAEFLVVDPAQGKHRKSVEVSHLGRFFSMGNRIAMDLRQEILAVGRTGGPARLGDRSTAQERQRLPFPKDRDYLSAIRFSPDGRYLAAAELEGPLRVWDLVDEKEVWQVPHSNYRFTTLAFSRDGRLLASGGYESAIQIWETTTGKEVCPQNAIHSWPRGLALTPDGRYAVMGSAEPALWLWDLRSSKLIQAKVLSGEYHGLAIDPVRGSVLVSRDKRLECWDLAKNELEPLPGAKGQPPIGKVHFSADGKSLVSICKDQVSLWDWPAGKLRRAWSITDPEAPEAAGVKLDCNSFAISHDAQQLATVTDRGTEGAYLGSR